MYLRLTAAISITNESIDNIRHRLQRQAIACELFVFPLLWNQTPEKASFLYVRMNWCNWFHSSASVSSFFSLLINFILTVFFVFVFRQHSVDNHRILHPKRPELSLVRLLLWIFTCSQQFVKQLELKQLQWMLWTMFIFIASAIQQYC